MFKNIKENELMKIVMYGAEICPDCVEAKDILKNHFEIELEYKNITENTSVLKEFLSYRDHDVAFAEVKENGRIGIPFFILEDGTKTFEISDFINSTVTNETISSCSLDGKGHC
jgi:glutaredoxin-related protein